MNIYIDNPLSAKISNHDIDFIVEILSRFAVSYQLVEYHQQYPAITLTAQKISLDEVHVNELFYDVLHPHFSFMLEYAPVGGAGCGMGVRVMPPSGV